MSLSSGHETPAYPGYATPTFVRRRNDAWFVIAAPGRDVVGVVDEHGPVGVGWTAYSYGRYVGLFPDKQAAGEALVRAAGYEVLR